MLKHHLGTLKLTPKDQKSVKGVVASNWLSPGPKVQEFEKAFSAFHQQKHGVMVNSGTDALRIALAALKERGNWKDGDLVYVPAVTFVATINVVLQLNLTPALVDVSMHDFNLNPDNLLRRYYTKDNEQNWPKNARCIIPVHLAGKPANMPKILDIAKKHKLAVLEDSCETMAVPGIGLGDATAFSFYVAHILTTGVGGMATTNDPSLANLMWSYCNHGRRNMGEFKFDRLGYSCRPTEFEATLGLNQLPKLKDIITQRRKVAAQLYWHLIRHPQLAVNFWSESANMFFPVVLLQGAKEPLMDHLQKRGIECRDLMPIIGQPCYKGLWDTGNGFSVAKELNKRAFYIGCHQDMTDTDVNEIGQAFDAYFGKGTLGKLSRPRAKKEQKEKNLDRLVQAH